MKRNVIWAIMIWPLTVAISAMLGWVAMSALMNQQEEPIQEEETVFVFAAPCVTCVYIAESGMTNEQNNPILTVDVYVDEELIGRYNALNGRAHTQDLDRNVAGIEAPSPNGTYTIMPETVGYKEETGGVFRPYEPNFQTQRSLLGFHIDPSWGLDNGEDGTIGCTAFKTLAEYNEFNSLVDQHNITKLIIDRK